MIQDTDQLMFRECEHVARRPGVGDVGPGVGDVGAPYAP